MGEGSAYAGEQMLPIFLLVHCAGVIEGGGFGEGVFWGLTVFARKNIKRT